MDSVMSGEAGESQIGAFLLGLASKGETVEEVAGCAESLTAHARPLNLPHETLDIVGTGGDKLNTVNISTMSVIVAAAAGAPVIKHGNRSASSMSGSADVLEALGVHLEATPEDVETIFTRTGLSFVFAQTFHPAMRHAAPARRQLGVSTIFNVLGPLINPANPVASAIGTPKENVGELIAGVLADRASRGLVFRGHDGADEMSVTAATSVWEVRDGAVTRTEITPEEVGLGRWTIKDLTGGDAQHNAQVVHAVLSGEPGAPRDAVLLNAAAGLVAYDQAADGAVVDRLRAKVEVAREAIDSGAAAKTLETWVATSQSFKK
jgi:anthranilate phosphoribosyltransferase